MHIIFESVLMLSTENYQNWSMFVEATACQIWRVFWDTVKYELDIICIAWAVRLCLLTADLLIRCMTCLRAVMRSCAASAWRCIRSNTSAFVSPATDASFIAIISSPVVTRTVHRTVYSCGISMSCPLYCITVTVHNETTSHIRQSLLTTKPNVNANGCNDNVHVFYEDGDHDLSPFTNDLTWLDPHHVVHTVSGGSGIFIFLGGGTGVATLSSGPEGHTTNTFVLNYRVCNRLYQIINT